MRWTPGGNRGNIEDRRGGGGGAGVPLGIGGTLLLAILSLVFGQDFFALIGNGGGGSGSAPISDPDRAREEPKVDFVTFVLNDAQKTWGQIFQSQGRAYQDAKLVLFRDVVRSACGSAGSATGPFYCPGDQKIYIDLSFFDELGQRFGAPGDFAQAYVLAHEVGHHVQTLMGVDRQVRQAQRGGNANALSVKMELQADCFAGVWGHSASQRGHLEEGDAAEGLRAAAAIGDDRLTQGRVSPDSFTHGTSEQRLTWLRRGLQSGNISACDTFNTQ